MRGESPGETHPGPITSNPGLGSQMPFLRKAWQAIPHAGREKGRCLRDSFAAASDPAKSTRSSGLRAAASAALIPGGLASGTTPAWNSNKT